MTHTRHHHLSRCSVNQALHALNWRHNAEMSSARWRFFVIQVGQLLIAGLIAVLTVTVGNLQWPAATLAAICFLCLSALILAKLLPDQYQFGFYVYDPPPLYFHRIIGTLLNYTFAVSGLLLIAVLGTRSLLRTFSEHGNLGPSEAPTLIGTIASLAGAVGVLVGAVCLGVSRIMRASGASQRDRNDGEAALVLARAEQMRAEAELIRARKGLPPSLPNEGTPGSPDQRAPD